MGMLQHIILGEDDARFLNIDPSKTVFWTGAGISCIPPSSLPLGNRLTDAFLETALGPKWKDFVVLWNNNFPQIRDSIKNGVWRYPDPIGSFTTDDVDNGKAWERPRLEYIIGEMEKLDKYFNRISFSNTHNNDLFHRKNSINALAHFAAVEPCLYHYRLADLAKAGAVIVTANFDNGIENALGVDSLKVKEIYGTPAVDNGSGDFIYHFHGIATDNPENLGATINAMSRGLDIRFQEYLRSCFELGYNIIFIGYGGVDFFDVEPFFRELKSNSYSGKAIYLDYCSDISTVAKKKLAEKHYYYLLDAFKNKYIVYGDTETFFDCLYRSYTPIIPKTADCGAFQKTKDELKQIASDQVDSDTYYFINAFRLCSQLNINPGRFYDDWIERIKHIYEIWETDGSRTIQNMAVVDDQRNDGIIDDIYSNNWHDTLLNETGIPKRLRRYIHGWDKKHKTTMLVFSQIFHGFGFPLPRFIIKKHVKKTIDILEKMKNDEESMDICRGTVLYLCGWQTKVFVFVYHLSNGFIKSRLIFLKECIDSLTKFPFTRFRYRTHYLSLCRQASYIESIINKGKNGYEGDIQKEWDICMQTPDLYDAGQVLRTRMIQAKWFGLSGIDELVRIRERILDLRKSKSDLRPF